MRTDIDNRKEEIVEWLRSGVPRMEVARRLKCKYPTLKSRLDKWGVTEKNQGAKGYKTDPKYRTAMEYINSGDYIASHKLKIKLIKDKVKLHQCENCWHVSWEGSPIPICLDHINGDHHDNRLENLRILCHNCHAQTDTFSGKNVGNYVDMP